MEEQIKKFVGEYEFLQMDYPCNIVFDDIKFKNATVAFLASKIKDNGAKRSLARLSAANARKKRNNIPENSEWEDNKEWYLYKVLEAKFNQNKDLKEKLLATNDKQLINNVTYPDTEYGIYNGRGSNILGLVLMKLRSDFKEEQTLK